MELETFHTILYPAEDELHFIRLQIGGGTFCVRTGFRRIILYNYADVGIDPLTGSVIVTMGMDVCIQFQRCRIELVCQLHQFLIRLVDSNLSGDIACFIHLFFTSFLIL
ncbi:MAG: hypothetical protein IJ334_16930 [Clostridia bacterium]|nr:hypothetical protein [Clostridia bacterium]